MCNYLLKCHFYNILFRGAEIMIGERLRKLRIKKGLGQKEIAAILEMSITGYSSYENNSRRPNIDSIIILSKYYGVSSDYILGIDEKTNLNKNDILRQLKSLRKQILELEKSIDNAK